MIGQTVSHYEITEKIGAGGMGEVYRARDTRLNRDVALKVLPQVFAQDKRRMGRFEREAQVLASLNHPHIAAIYGLEEANGTKALAMELVEGEDLSERIARGPIPVDEALPIALQIAEALEDAHEKGIIHRDLKPANIKLTPEGKVKVLDFGLAKALEEDRTQEEMANSPTLTAATTEAGTILGTAAYMSPEQARGKTVDRRTDIWAFGALLYEMLTSQRAFGGKDILQVMAHVITLEPDWERISEVPREVRTLLKRCLRKDPRKRLPDIAAARFTLEESLELHAPGEEPLAGPVRFRFGVGVVLAAVAGLVIGLGFTYFLRPAEVGNSLEQNRFDLILNPPVAVGRIIVISPDGRILVYPARTGGTTTLYQRHLSEEQAVPIPGTEGGVAPFFSPDSRWVGFFSGGRLRKVFLDGGQSVPVCSYSGYATGGVWKDDGSIIFLSGGNQMPQKVSAEGGLAETMQVQFREKVVITGRPQLVGDSGRILITVKNQQRPHESQVGILDVKNWNLELVTAGSDARFVEPGFLIYVHSDQVMVARFDPELGKLKGPGRVLPVDQKIIDGAVKSVRSAFSPSLAVFRAAPTELKGRVVWVDRQGREVSEIELDLSEENVTNRSGIFLRLSPEGKRLVVTGDRKMSVIELESGRKTDLIETQGMGTVIYPHWSPNGKLISYIDNRSGPFLTYSMPADGTGQIRLLTDMELTAVGTSFAPDGKSLLGYLISPVTLRDLWLFALDGGESRPLLETPSNERAPTFSPDGSLIAFISDETGRDQIYVRQFPESPQNWKVTSEGGVSPAWSRDGNTLFYRSKTHLMMIPVQRQPVLQFGAPKALFDAGEYYIEPFGIAAYDISLDDSEFLFPHVMSTGLDQWSVIQNWTNLLETIFED